MPTLSSLLDLLHGWYPPATADSWDAVGLVAGDPDQAVTKVLFAVDPTLPVAEEAAEWGADLLVVHHPLFLKGVHGVARTTPKGRTLGVLQAAGCALLTAHTNADQAVGGVSEALAMALGLTDLRRSLRTATTARQADDLRAGGGRRPGAPALSAAGRRGDRRLRPRIVLDTRRGPVPAARGGQPDDRRDGELEVVDEVRIECVLPRSSRPKVVRRCWPPTPTRSRPSTWSSWPTRAPADGVGPDRRRWRRRRSRASRGGGGALPATAHGVRVAGDPDRVVRRVAVCGGAGDFLLDESPQRRGRLRHQRPAPPPGREFLEQGGPALIDVAHWAAEWTWLPVVAARLGRALGATVDTRVSTICTDPWTIRISRPAPTGESAESRPRRPARPPRRPGAGRSRRPAAPPARALPELAEIAALRPAAPSSTAGAATRRSPSTTSPSSRPRSTPTSSRSRPGARATATGWTRG